MEASTTSSLGHESTNHDAHSLQDHLVTGESRTNAGSSQYRKAIWANLKIMEIGEVQKYQAINPSFVKSYV